MVCCLCFFYFWMSCVRRICWCIVEIGLGIVVGVLIKFFFLEVLSISLFFLIFLIGLMCGKISVLLWLFVWLNVLVRVCVVWCVGIKMVMFVSVNGLLLFVCVDSMFFVSVFKKDVYVGIVNMFGGEVIVWLVGVLDMEYVCCEILLDFFFYKWMGFVFFWVDFCVKMECVF